jgi:hypothetical protein
LKDDSQYKVDVSHIIKFDKPNFHVWNKITLLFKQKKVWQIVKGTEAKPINPTATQTVVGTLALPITRAGCISDWVEGDNLALTIINNCFDNSVISHVKSKLASNKTVAEIPHIKECTWPK